MFSYLIFFCYTTLCSIKFKEDPNFPLCCLAGPADLNKCLSGLDGCLVSLANCLANLARLLADPLACLAGLDGHAGLDGLAILQVFPVILLALPVVLLVFVGFDDGSR